RDVREGVQAYDFLVQSNELESATKRLGEAFSVGEYMPEIRTLPREKKRKALVFAQKTNQLISAIEVRDYTLAEKLVTDLKAMAKTRQDQLKQVLDNMQIIEIAMMKAGEIAKQGNYPGAWESVEKAFKQFPEDSKLNQLRANLTTQAADFVRTLRTAEDLEQK